MRAGKLDKLVTIEHAPTTKNSRGEEVEGTWQELADYVVGTDTNDYVCIADHTSVTATNRPITGTDYATFWEATAVTGGVWANSTAYTSGRVWADIRPLEGKETFESQQIQSSIDTEIEMRYRSDVKTDMRIVFGSQTYYIEAIINDPKVRDHRMLLKCIEHTDDDD